MKKYLIFASLLLGMFVFLFVACSDDDDGPSDMLPAGEAKAEINAANQEIMTRMGTMMNTQAATSLSFLMEMMDFYDYDDDWKTHLKSGLADFHKKTPAAIKRDFFKSFSSQKSMQGPNPEDKGVYQYNYVSGQFDLVNSGVNYLQIIFPADEEDYYNEGLNATLTVSQYEYITIIVDDYWDEYEDILPTRIKMNLVAYGVTAMDIDFTASYDSAGVPTNVSANMQMPPYALVMSLTGSGRNIVSSMSFKENTETMFAYDAKITLSADKEDLDFVEGFFQVTPLKVQGEIDGKAMNTCADNNVECMNKSLDLKLIHVEKNVILGNIEFRLYDDPYWDESYPMFAVVYADGSYDFLQDIFEMDGLVKK